LNILDILISLTWVISMLIMQSQQLTTSSGFEYGYPNNQSAVKPRWYGLWNPNHDCFVWVSDDVQQLETLQMLLSGKCVVTILELDCSLYENNVIDNACCTNWTVSDVNIGFNEVYKNFRDIPKCDIVQRAHDHESTDSLNKLTQWIVFLNNWVRKINEDYHNRFERFVHYLMRHQEQDFTRDLYHILLLGSDIDETEKQLVTYIKNNTINV
jgi:hypothetical protein